MIEPGKLWNPYLRLLQDALGEAGVRYRGGIGFLWWGDYSLVHVHWPEAMARHRLGLAALLKSALLVGGLVAARLRGRKVIWTVHNLQTHEGAARPMLEGLARRVFLRTVSGVILLSAGAEDEFLNRYPELADRSRVVIPHGHYRAIVIPNADRVAAREKAGLADAAAVITFFGLVRPYKGVRELIEAFRDADIANSHLIVAGQTMGGSAEPDFSRTIEQLIDASDRVTGQLRRLSDHELSLLMATTDLTVLPFRRVLNSGSVLYALSSNRPVCAPRLGGLQEIQAKVGSEWLYLYEPPLTPEILKDALRWALAGERGERPDLGAFDWSAIALAHRAFFASF